MIGGLLRLRHLADPRNDGGHKGFCSVLGGCFVAALLAMTVDIFNNSKILIT